MAVLPQYKLVARKVSFLKLQYYHNSGNNKPDFWHYFIATTTLFLVITYCKNLTILATFYCQKLEHAQWALLESLPLIILEGTDENKKKNMCLTKICFNHEQEHISQVFLIQVSVFQIVCLLFNTVFFLMVAIFLKLLSSFVLHEFWKLAYL